jgi:integrase
VVPIPPFLAEMLSRYLANRPHGPEDLVFTARDGSNLKHNSFYRGDYKPAVKHAGLPAELRFHDLRHTCAALLIAQGAHPKAIQTILGHSTIAVTMDRYGHLFPDELDRLANGLDVAYRTASSPAVQSAAVPPQVVALR